MFITALGTCTSRLAVKCAVSLGYEESKRLRDNPTIFIAGGSRTQNMYAHKTLSGATSEGLPVHMHCSAAPVLLHWSNAF